MGLGGYLAARSDAEHYLSERRREEQEIRDKTGRVRRKRRNAGSAPSFSAWGASVAVCSAWASAGFSEAIGSRGENFLFHGSRPAVATGRNRRLLNPASRMALSHCSNPFEQRTRPPPLSIVPQIFRKIFQPVA
jgi:hypothetical protein